MYSLVVTRQKQGTRSVLSKKIVLAVLNLSPCKKKGGMPGWLCRYAFSELLVCFRYEGDGYLNPVYRLLTSCWRMCCACSYDMDVVDVHDGQVTSTVSTPLYSRVISPDRNIVNHEYLFAHD